MNKKFFEINNVDFKIGNKVKVKNVSFSIENEGDIICLLGPSGIGKTTILRTIAGLQNINKGSIELKGKTLSSKEINIEPENRNVSLAFQENSLLPHYDIKKNILSSLGFAPDENTVWNTEDVEAIFKNSVISFVIDKNGDIVEGMLPEDIDPKIDNEVYPIYKKMNNDRVEGFAIPISGKGLWGTMYGYFAIEPDGATAKGITFYKHCLLYTSPSPRDRG